MIIKGKNANTPTQEAGEKPTPADPKTQPENTQAADLNAVQGAYGAQTTRPLITQKDYDTIEKKTWMDDPKSRLGIRMFSRGLMGAAFFTGGGALTKKWMVGYDPSKSMSEIMSKQGSSNPLQVIAKLIDNGIGKPIEAGVTALAGKEMGLRSVSFRPTNANLYKDGVMHGRSLGDEAVNITFDFFCASVGDAWGRDIAGWVDPNVKKSWIDDKGHVSVPDAVTAAVTAVTRYASYNGGEDWAVAIPYAYFMKGQRALINKASPGFKYDFDRGINGGSAKMMNGQHVGNYNLEGIIDLQNRFTAYNIGTLMYREAYDHIGNKLAGKQGNLYGAPDEVKHLSLAGKIGELAKWTARSVVKGVIVMTPSVPFFWITRTPQGKAKSAFIDPEHGILANAENNKAIQADGMPFKNPDQSVVYGNYVTSHTPNDKGMYDNFRGTNSTTINAFEPKLAQAYPNATRRNNYDSYAKTFGIGDTALNAVGKANYKIAGLFDKPAGWADKSLGNFGQDIKSAFGYNHKDLSYNNKFQSFTRPMVNASLSYTPYMYAKAEFANMWDDGKMDMSAERMIDGAASFNWGEFKAGAKEVWNSILQRPLDDPKRDAEAKRRDKIDTSAADIFNESHAEQAEQKEKAIEKKKHEVEKNQHDADENMHAATVAAEPVAAVEAPQHELRWQDRVISKPVEKPKVEKLAGSDGASLEDTYKIAHRTLAQNRHHPEKLVEREAQRKALEELNPPTNSIN